ncbi:GT2 family glycosyltransferase [Sphingomonas zeicaulis]|uniref:glycosyltransferase family 2 protein n=1 Tax=Sphingomonas zeicaulis TaxID=1632740 RepID=UPI003D1C052C
MDQLLSVIIPHYNDVDNLVRCIAMLQRQSIGTDSFEIVVADNNSPIGIEAVRAAVGDTARVIEAPEQGAGPARNAAVAASRGEILAFIDSDCRPQPDWLERGVAALANADVVGGRVDIVAVDPARPNPIEAFEKATAFPIRDYVERKSFAVTANLFVTRAVFDKVGTFRSTVAEDMDWCRRAVALGYRLVYADDVAMAHPARATWAELSRKWRRTTSETFALTMERPGGRGRWIAQCVMVLASVPPHGAKMLVTPKLKGAGARAGAVATLARIRWFRFTQGLALLARRH